MDAFASTSAVNGQYKEDLNRILICTECNENPPNLVEEYSSGDLVCGSCGIVLGERIIDHRSEWRTFSNDDQGNDDPSRVGDGPNTLLDGDQLQTTIGSGVKGKNARSLVHAQNKITQDKGSKALMAAYRDIGTLCDSINAGRAVADAAKHIFKLVDDAKVMKGKSQEVIISGCIFIACRQLSVPRTFKEIFALTSVPKKEIGRIFKALEAFLGKKDISQRMAHIQALEYKGTGSTSAEELCARYCSKLQFSNPVKTENIAKALARKTSGVSELAGRSPLSIAAACIYMASYIIQDRRSTKDIARVSGVSDGTVKTAYKKLKEAAEDIVERQWLPDEFKDKPLDSILAST